MKHLWRPYFVKLKGAPEPSLYVLCFIYNELWSRSLFYENLKALNLSKEEYNRKL